MSKPIDKTTTQYMMQSLVPGLTAILTRENPNVHTRSFECVAAADAVGFLARNGNALTLPALLRSPATPLPQQLPPLRRGGGGRGTGAVAPAAPLPLLPPLPAQFLVDLLKYPLVVGSARRVVLDQLQRHYHRPFTDQWDFVRFARERKLALDLTSPPRRPTAPGGPRP